MPRAGNDGYYNLQKQHSTNSGNGGSNNVANSEGYSYVDDVPSLQSSHHRHSTSSSQQKSTSSSSHRDYQQPNRTRRTQRRVTHNEKRYHSGLHFTPVRCWCCRQRPKPNCVAFGKQFVTSYTIGRVYAAMNFLHFILLRNPHMLHSHSERSNCFSFDCFPTFDTIHNNNRKRELCVEHFTFSVS